MSRMGDLAERKSLLVAQSDLQRMQAQLAWQEVRRLIAPAPQRGSRTRNAAATVISFAMPFFGPGRLRRLVRFGSIGIMAFRALRRWMAR
jgi:hypothetical protein